MSLRKLTWTISIIPIFFAAYLLHIYLVNFFDVQNKKLANKIFDYLIGISALMLVSLLITNWLKPKITGFVFLVWSMLKIILIMLYFILFIIPHNIKISNALVFDFMIIYAFLLIYEVIFSIQLIQKK